MTRIKKKSREGAKTCIEITSLIKKRYKHKMTEICIQYLVDYSIHGSISNFFSRAWAKSQFRC